MNSFHVSKKFLSALYLIVPICFILVLSDQLFFSSKFKNLLPTTPNDLFIFNVFFVLPHIIASSTTLVDREYLSFYKNKLLIALALTGTIAFIFPHLFSQQIVLIINGIMTVYHVLAQQLGVTSTIAKIRSKNYQRWKWIGLILGALVYYLFYFHQKIPSATFYYLEIAVYVLTLIFLFYSVKIIGETQEKLGKIYIASNFFLILSAFYFIKAGYPFFAMLAPRVVHDLTAFSFYTVHDSNRNANGAKNYFMKYLLPLKTYPVFCFFIFTPLLGISLALLTKAYLIFPIVNFLTLFHYATESFVWKSEGIHRKHIGFS
jgi:hypothetical protein